jgi:hypothetical protein
MDKEETQNLRVSKEVQIETEFTTVNGGYETAGDDFRRSLDLLSDAQYKIDKVSQVGSGVVVSWSVSFIPETAVPLASVAKAVPGLKLVLYDILDRERFTTTFSWRQLRQFFAAVLMDAEVRLPKAVIQGQTRLEFTHEEKEEEEGREKCSSGSSDSSGAFVLTKSTERLHLVRSVDGGLLQNRAIAAHLLEYAAARKPRDVSFNGWDDITTIRLQIQRVPGMRQFDIDGLDGQQQRDVLSASNNILGFAFGVVSLFSLAFSLTVMDKVLNH